jgi:hypothetical protein
MLFLFEYGNMIKCYRNKTDIFSKLNDRFKHASLAAIKYNEELFHSRYSCLSSQLIPGTVSPPMFHVMI